MSSAAPEPSSPVDPSRVDPTDAGGDEFVAAPTGPAKPPIRARVALGLAIATLVVLGAMASTVAGSSDLALAAGGAGADADAALLGVTMGFALGVLLGVATLITAIDPIITNRGRGLAVTAGILALTSPLLVVALTQILALF